MKNFVEELKWRGLLHDIMPGTEEQLAKEKTTAYIGFDPTADSLHIGSLVQIFILKHFQLCGHKPIALVGGATGMVGDPSGKSAERNLLDETTLNHNIKGVQAQLERYLDFSDAEKPVTKLGDAYMMDYRVIHGGLPNDSDTARPILYLVYSRPWFRDGFNFSSQPSVQISKKQRKKVPERWQGPCRSLQ